MNGIIVVPPDAEVQFVDMDDFSLKAQIDFMKTESEMLDELIKPMKPGIEKSLWEYRAKMFKSIQHNLSLLNAIS